MAVKNGHFVSWFFMCQPERPSKVKFLLGKLLMLPFSGRRWTRPPPSFLACFLLSFFVSSKPLTFLFLQFLPIFSLLCTTWTFTKFQILLSVFVSPYSGCPLIRSDEALWRNVIYSIKNFEKSKQSKPRLSTTLVITHWFRKKTSGLS